MFLQSSSVVVFLFPPLPSFLTFHSEQRFTPDVSARRRVRKPVIFLSAIPNDAGGRVQEELSA
jgi:hypothetical protein